jgi:hypothetical protein
VPTVAFWKFVLLLSSIPIFVQGYILGLDA